MFIETQPICRKWGVFNIKVGERVVRSLDIGDSVVLDEGIDSASSDEFTTLAKVVDPCTVELIHLWGFNVVSLGRLETFQVKRDSRTKGYLRWVDSTNPLLAKIDDRQILSH